MIERDRLLAAFYLEGNTIATAAKRYGISSPRAYGILRSEEIRQDRAILRHDRGHPVRSVA